MNPHSSSWQSKYLGLAQHISTWSKDPSTKVGAVVVNKDQQILSIGYNGFPRGIEDDHRLNNRDEKYKLVVHAEMNAIYNATHNGVSLNNSVLYVHGLPVCSDCANGIIQSGIKYVVMTKLDEIPDKWLDSFIDGTAPKFIEAGVEYSWRRLNYD